VKTNLLIPSNIKRVNINCDSKGIFNLEEAISFEGFIGDVQFEGKNPEESESKVEILQKVR
jgi:hypothetical protein